MPQFPEEYVTEGWVETTVADTDKLLVNNNAVEAKDVAVAMARATQTTQTVTSSPATVSARFVVLDDDSHTSGAPGSLVMPPITEGAWHVIATPYEDVHYIVTNDAGDPVGTGPDLTIDSSFIRQQTIVLVAVERDGILRWQCDSTGYYITTIFGALNTLGAAGIGAQVIPGISGTVTDALDVFGTNTGANITIGLPDAIAGRRIRYHKANSATTQTIEFIRSAGDTISGTINGATANLSIVFAGITGPFRSWDITCRVDGAWHIENGETLAIASLVSSVGTNTSDIAALDTRIDTLEAIATTPLSSTTGTTLSWEAQERVRLANTGSTHCLVTLNGDTDEWPVGRARACSQYGSTTGGFTLAVPSGHKLNTVTNGTSGVIGTNAADDGTALYTVTVTREASDEWSWA